RAGGSQPARWPLLPARTRLVLQGWQVAAACALVVVLAWAGPWLSWWSGRKPPGWAASAETCERALAGRIPAETTEVVSRAIGKIRARGGRRWHGAHVYLSRCTSTGPRRPPHADRQPPELGPVHLPVAGGGRRPGHHQPGRATPDEDRAVLLHPDQSVGRQGRDAPHQHRR